MECNMAGALKCSIKNCGYVNKSLYFKVKEVFFILNAVGNIKYYPKACTYKYGSFGYKYLAIKRKYLRTIDIIHSIIILIFYCFGRT